MNSYTYVRWISFDDGVPDAIGLGNLQTDVFAFGGSGPDHAPGLVPDPGATLGSARFLCEDGTWQAALYNLAIGNLITGPTRAGDILTVGNYHDLAAVLNFSLEKV